MVSFLSGQMPMNKISQIFNRGHAELILANIETYIFIFWNFSTAMVQEVEMFILHCQYHGSCWPRDAKSQIISNHGIDLLLKFQSQKSGIYNF